MTSRCTRNPNGEKYVPLDELLAMPRVRILRYLRHCDWATTNDVHVALDVGSHDVNTYNQTISRLVKERLLDRREVSARDYLYRITAAGRLQYEQLMARAQKLPPMTDLALLKAEHDDEQGAA